MNRSKMIKRALENEKQDQLKKEAMRCRSCNGVGYYDHCFNNVIPQCDSCNGTGIIVEKTFGKG